MTDRPTRTLADIGFLVEHWPHLVEERLPGTARPWRQAELTPERRAQLDALARIERHERAEAPGESEAPMHVDVLDVLTALTAAACRLASQAAYEAGCALLLPALPGPHADPRMRLGTLAEHLPAASEETQSAAADKFAALAADTATVLRLIRDGQRLDAECPWCGQARALVVRVPENLPAMVACESARVCEPPDRDCGIRWRGRPAWSWHEWDWLADRIAYLAATRPAPLPAGDLRVARADGGCWVWQGAQADTPHAGCGHTCGRDGCVRPDHLTPDGHTQACRERTGRRVADSDRRAS